MKSRNQSQAKPLPSLEKYLLCNANLLPTTASNIQTDLKKKLQILDLKNKNNKYSTARLKMTGKQSEFWRFQPFFFSGSLGLPSQNKAALRISSMMFSGNFTPLKLPKSRINFVFSPFRQFGLDYHNGNDLIPPWYIEKSRFITYIYTIQKKKTTLRKLGDFRFTPPKTWGFFLLFAKNVFFGFQGSKSTSLQQLHKASLQRICLVNFQVPPFP